MADYSNLNNYLKKVKKSVSPLLFSYLKCEPEEYCQIISEYPKRMGKYLRPALVMLATELHGGNPQDALQIAAAIQMSEEWLLIHDDAEDHSCERRSTKAEYRPTINKALGWEIAINTGDTLHAIMWKVVADYVKTKKNGWKIFDKISDIIIKTTEGQYQELEWIRNNHINISQKDYFQMIDKKTAYYSIIGPLQLGAMIAGVPNAKIKEIEKFGKPLGRLFQIRDDVLNFISNSQTAGKEQYSDVAEGKRTLILMDLLNKCSYIEDQFIRTIYRSDSREKSDDEMQYIISAVKRYNCIADVSAIAYDYAKQAKGEFMNYCKQTKVNIKTKRIFLELIDFIALRDH